MTVDLFTLDGSRALVTGASSGLGAEFASVLHAAGAQVAVVARRADRLEELCAKHPGMVAFGGDVADEASVAATVERVHESFGDVDVLVNNAGTTWPGRAEDEPLSEFRRVIDVNLIGAFHLTQLVGRRMLANRRGSVINVASILGMVAGAPNNQASYCASKGALINLTRELAVQWARSGVRVNALAPGFFPSELTGEFLDDEAGAEYVRRNTPMRRPGRTGELAGALLLLASDAGSYITGQVLTVDGGWTAR